MTEPQLSPGGQWWWTGDAWVAAADHPDGAAALAALSGPPAPAVPAQPAAPPPALALAPVPAVVPAPAPVPVTATPPPVAQAPAAPVAAPAAHIPEPVAPEPVAEPLHEPMAEPAAEPAAAGEPAIRPAGWAPPAQPALPGSTSAPKGTIATLAKPIAFVGVGLGVIALVVGVVVPAIHHTQKDVQTTVNKPIVAAANIELKAVATNAAQAEAAAFAESNTYVGMPGLVAQGFRPTKGVTVTVVSADTRHFCLKLAGLATSVAYYDSMSSLVSSKPCR